jgi:tetratricopeptide (TPR) repeat protein
VSNIKDQPPFVSVAADTFPTAARAYEIGKKLEAQEQYQDARTALYYAKDLDALRFRATEEMNQIIHEVAAEFSAPVVPMKDYFEAQSEHGLIGNNLIIEHLHPNVHGYFVMADAFLNTMKDHHFISDNWDESRILPPTYYQQNWGITELDTVSANLDILYLKGSWPFQPQGQPNHTLDNYFPKTEAESLAVHILVDDKYSPVVGHADMAKYYEKKKEYEKAYEEYRAAYYAIPFELDFYRGAVENLLKINRLQEALRVLQFANRYVYDAFTDKWTGTLLAGVGKFEEALPYLERAVKEAPDDTKLPTFLKRVYEQLNKPDQAAKIAEKIGQEPAAETNKSEPNPMTQEGQLQIAYGALLQQGQKFIEKKDYKAALQFFRRAHSIKQTPITYKWVGLLEVAVGDLSEGADTLNKAFELMPEDFEIAYNLCHADIKLKRKDDAEKVLKRMETLRPNFKDPQNLRGQIAKM